jgi:ABC-type sugar transport system ATPase subunit
MKILEMNGIVKNFGVLTALDNVDFSLSKGEVRGVMGINGAGKSTLMKILSGIYQMDSGEIIIDGLPETIETPEKAENLGIAIVHQEFSLIPHLTVAENLFISRLPISNKITREIDRSRMISESRNILSKVGIDIDPNICVSELSIGNQQMVEIAKAVSLKNPKIIVFDEPTSALSSGEILKLYDVISNLKKSDIGIIYITHKLNEFEDICDSITVLRDGRLIGDYEKDSKSLKELITLMLGKQSAVLKGKKDTHESKDVVLELKDTAGINFEGPVSFNIKKGEIVGLIGQMGAGRSEVLKSIIGIDSLTEGSIIFNDCELTGSVEKRIGCGLGYVAEDRKREGLLPTRNIFENLSISVLFQLLGSFLISKRKQSKLYESIAETTSLSPREPELLVTQLSGGNQQKVVIGRCLAINNLKLLLLDEPTRGVDVGAKYQIYNILNQLTDKGISILIASSDLEEILILCDRVVHLADRASIDERNAADLSLNSLTCLISGEK